MDIKLASHIYWKLKAKLLEIQMAEKEIFRQKVEILKEAGLDPQLSSYLLNDEELTVTIPDKK